MRYEAVRLLADRAAAAVPGFAVDDENARDVARICFRLDGLPLALELAAARLGGLGTSTLAERLDDRFRLLRTDSRPAPTRQQTLLATLQWSHDLLTVPEQVLLRRLAVFAGGFELAAAEDVCADEQLPRRGDRRRARAAGREVAREHRRRRPRPPLPAARERAPVRGRAPGRGRRAGAVRAAARALGAGAGRARGRARHTSTARWRTCARPTTRSRPSSGCATAWPCCRCGSGASTSRRHTGASSKRSRALPSPPASAPRRCWRCPRSTTAPARSRAAKSTCARPTRSPSELGATEPAMAHAAALRRIRDRPRRGGARREALRAGPPARPARGPRGRGGGVGLLARRGPPQRGRPRRSRSS